MATCGFSLVLHAGIDGNLFAQANAPDTGNAAAGRAEAFPVPVGTR